MTVAEARSQSLRVLFVTHNYPRFSGDAAGSFLHRLAIALTSAQHTVRVLAPASPGYRGRAELEGIPVDRIAYASPAQETLAYTGTMAESVRGSWRARFTLLQLFTAMRRAVRRELQRARDDGTPYDVVHAQWWFPAGLLVRMAVASYPGSRGTPAIVITAHGSDVRLATSVPLSHPILRWVMSGAQQVTAVSSWLADALRALIPGVAVQVAPMPVDPHLFIASESAPSDHAPVDATVLFVGRLNTQKGAAELLRAIAVARTRTSARFHCAVVGDGPDAGLLRQLAADLGIESLVTWHGALPASALPALYQSATVTVMPSREEGLGLVAVESQLCATPVIGYESGGLPDVVSPAHGGTLVPVGNIDALGTAIAAMVSDAARARALGKLGRAFVHERYAPHAVAARYTMLYQDALRSHSPAGHAP
jgi:glycosyltransferase involved in cell wall biosynthesis